jgi:MoaA/NifB/PqqE/SkfB family radical SAM enzyme
MIEKVLKKVFSLRRRRPFSAWQVELTTRCPLRCRMCIRTESDDWQYQDMAFDQFEKILPYLKDVETVILEGWGESLLYGNLPECVRRVKREGCQVGFVTSGIGLTRDRMSGLIEEGLDFVGFSVSGTRTETHDGIRVNSHLPNLIETIRMFQEERAVRNLDRPRFHMVFLMVRKNIQEVPGVPAFAREVGIEEVVLTNICHMINTWQEKQRVFVWEEKKSEYETLVKEAESNARRLKVKLSRPSLSPRDVPVCDENPLRNLYISAEGEVSPCVYLFPALPSPFRRIFCSREYRVDRVSFGNIFESPFPAIWNVGGYQHFRDRFNERQRKFNDLYYSLWGDARMKDARENTLPSPPEPCQTCHKILGI